MAFDFGDIKDKIDDIVEKLKKNPNAMRKFKDDPEGAVQDVAGIDLPDGILEKVVNGVKSALASDKLKDVAEDVGDKLKGLFGKD